MTNDPHIKIGMYGVDADRRELHMAILAFQSGKGKKIVLDIPHPHVMDEEMVREVIQSGGRVDLGCDAAMTPEGKAAIVKLERIEREVTPGQ